MTAVVLFAASAAAANAFADVLSSATAMACCAKTHNECAGLGTPDDCCQRMGHTALHSVAGTVAKAHSQGLATMARFPSVVANVLSRVEPQADLAFTRPHDPPHLHSFCLLI